MSASEKIAIIPDTNYLYMDEKRKDDFSKLSLKRYHKIKNSFEFLEISGKIEIFIPELVLLELLAQYKRDLKREIKTYENQKKKLNDLLESKTESDIDIDTQCEKLKEKYLHELRIIHIPKEKSRLFDEIFEMALDKKAPFSKADKSDKGFKDSILFLSFLEFAKKTRYDQYIFISGDKGFLDNIEEVESRFEMYSLHPRKKLQIKDEDGFEEWFNEKYGLYEDLRQIIDEKFIPDVEYKYSRHGTIEIEHNKFMIDYCDFIKNQTRIYQKSENKFEVEIYFSIDLNFTGHHPDELYGMEDMENITQKEVYLFEKIKDYWDCTLCEYDYSIDYEPYEEYDDHYPFKRIREKFNINMPKNFNFKI